MVEKAFGVDTDDGKKGKKTAAPPAETAPVTHLDIPDLPTPTEQSATQITPPTFTLRMTVSSGTYVRSIVHDIALAVGSAAHVVKLTRTRQGQFSLDPSEEDTTTKEAEQDVQDTDSERFDFGERKTGCIPWAVFERAIEERKSARKEDESEEPEVVDEEEAAGNEAALPKWEPKEWEREFLARFVPV